MGAEQFFNRSEGETAEAAFNAIREQAQYDYGHAGYTGTIAEKTSFTVIDVPDDFRPDLNDVAKRACAFADALLEDDDERIADKWGPAGCVYTGDNTYLFFGWASS